MGPLLVTKEEPNCSSKLDTIRELLQEFAGEEDRKVVMFSEWTTMLGFVESIVEDLGLSYVRLDGSVPQKQRQQLVRRFSDDSDGMLFLATNAGATGLNLQAADTVVNIDLPWNPAVLIRDQLSQCLSTDTDGAVQLTVTLPDAGALDSLARAVAGLIDTGA